MTVQGVFETALLKYIQTHVDQLAEGIRGYEHDHSCCWGHDADDYCYCDTSVRMSIHYTVAREINKFGYTWQYNGGFSDLINMLDRTEATGE